MFTKVFNLVINKKALFLLILSISVLLFMVLKSFILKEDVKLYLLIFSFVGFGLSFLRIFVNSMIKKLKGKHLFVKILFFVVLLSVGLPFQNWFRKDVIMAMSSNYILPCLIVGISGMIFMTILYGVIYQNKRLPNLK